MGSQSALTVKARRIASDVKRAGSGSLRDVVKRLVVRIEVTRTSLRLELRCDAFLQGPDSDAAATSGGGTSETISAVRPFERPPCNGAQSLIIEGVTENPEDCLQG